MKYVASLKAQTLFSSTLLIALTLVGCNSGQ